MGRTDYSGGSNRWAPLDMLNCPHDLARLIARVLGGKTPVEPLPLLKRMAA